MSKSPIAISEQFSRDNAAQYIANTWQNLHQNKSKVIENWKELRNYVFATDTTTTSNKSLPWKNSTTLPKLCQIRDNLHSNYISALFPNDDWLKWEAYSQNDAIKKKQQAITAYMSNKTRVSEYRGEVSKLLYDYIDYGNAFATVSFERSYLIDEAGEKIADYVGPRIHRISPLDIVFNPIATSFRETFKIIRSIKTIGELHAMATDFPGNEKLASALRNRNMMLDYAGRSGLNDLDKDDGFNVDGFGNYSDYFQGDFVEVLDFYGDIYDKASNTLRKGMQITVIDRMWTIQERPIPSWLGHAPIYHVGWRTRPDNLWAMGPLENLVGMQYRIDHLENAKADAMDLAIMPPLKIKGDVEQFVWAPNAEIHLDENGDVEEIMKNVQWVLAADTSIERLEQRMELFAGAPREAMGVRSAGEKTAFEVQSLQNAAGRIFQEKISTFEVEMLERTLNAMLEVSKRTMDVADIVRVMDDDLGVEQFIKITKEDITASGKLRPVGSRHFAAQSQLVQNLTNLSNTKMWDQVAPHMSGLALSKLIEDSLGLARYGLFSPNTGVMEAQDTQRTMNQVNEDLAVEQQTPPIA